MGTTSSTGVHVAAGIVCAVFVPFVLIHLLWAVGMSHPLPHAGRRATTSRHARARRSLGRGAA